MNDMVMLAVGDDSFRTALKTVLQEMNLDVREVSQGPQAIRNVAAFRPDLLIVDDTLPYLGGYQFCRLFKFGLHLDTPLILIVSSGQKIDQFWGTSCGADYCRFRSINTQELKQIVQEALKSRKPHRYFFQPSFIGQHLSDLDILKMANDLLDRHLFQEKLLSELRSLPQQVDSVSDLVSAMMPILGSLFFFRSAVVFLYYEARASLFVSLLEEVGQSRLDYLYAHLLAHTREKEGLDVSLEDTDLTLLGPARPDAQASLEDLEDRDIFIFSGKILRNAICYVAFDGLDVENLPEPEEKIFRLILQKVLETMEEKITFEKSIPFSIIDIVNQEADRSVFLKILGRNMEQARRFQIPLALVGLVLENYSQLIKSSDKKGNFLQEISTTLLNAVRKMDVVARIDENRFILVLFKANAEQARTVYQRVKMFMEDLSPANLPPLIQGGFCVYDSSFGLQAEEFLLTACSRIFSETSKKSPPKVETGHGPT